MSRQFLFSSESVTEGHPDKICDQISDAFLDAHLNGDDQSRVAAELLVNTGLVMVSGEITSATQVDYVDLVRNKLTEIGYTDADNGFSADSCSVLVALDKQSPDISQGVSSAQESREKLSEDELDSIGAGDQGLMFGFACNETPELMPMPISLAHRATRRLAAVRKTGDLPYLRPDGKSQVTVAYENGKPVGIDTILLSTQHDPSVDGTSDEDKVHSKIQQDLWEAIVKPVFSDIDVKPDANTNYLVNPTGKFVVGGPQGDCGLTGRKIIVDTYGGYARHGGGAFSGKDPTKVDRSAAYASRYVAKNIVAAGLADKCEVQLSYAIGVARPVSILVDTFGTGKVEEDRLLELVKAYFELRPAGILQDFNLTGLPRQQGGRFYQDIAAYGHFGRTDLELPWERTDKAEALREAAKQSAKAGA
ncbi:MAG: methionine adenosyltransferase [Cyanobacteria bacterium QS_8_64_29]|nr:MAG: methionine adenosyltransferase [Cyanobacteria bacterium QS_8_64_29]